jgi:hypothetical protein
VTHAYNPSYKGGRDQEDLVQRQSRQIVCETLSQKNSSQKSAGGVAQGEGSELKPQYHKKQKQQKPGKRSYYFTEVALTKDAVTNSLNFAPKYLWEL